MKKLSGVSLLVVAGVACLCLFCSQASAQALYKDLEQGKPVAVASFSPGGITWEPQVPYESVVLTVSGGGSIVLQEEFEAGTAPSIGLQDEDGKPLADGQYRYELRFAPVVAPSVRQRLTAVQESEDRSAYVAELRSTGVLPKEALVESGSFRVLEGRIVLPDGVETNSGGTHVSKRHALSQGNSSIPRALDQVTADDLIVQGSLCVGTDCIDGESFGFDTIKLKEDNLRIFFDDASTLAGFPANDWRIIVNDSTSGGANYFAVEDSTAGKTPFKIEAGARTNALFVDSTGRIGIGTSTPILDIHVVTGNTPALRLHQDGSVGYSPQTWDVAGNEANFFVRDVTGGSRLPFRIRPGAPTSSIDIAASGFIGIGTATPTSPLTVYTSTAGNLLKLETTSAVGGAGFGSRVLTGGLWYSKGTMGNGFKIRDAANSKGVLYLQYGTGYIGTKAAAGKQHVEFIAEDVPELVGTKNRKGLSPMDIVAVLTKVAQEKSQLIEKRERALDAMENRLSALEKQ